MKVLLVILLIAVSASADTLYFVVGSSINGHVSYAKGRFIIASRFNGKIVQTTVERENVRRVEFNSVVDNSGRPPGEVAMSRKDQIYPNAPRTDTVRLKDGKLFSGTLDQIDEDNISMVSTGKRGESIAGPAIPRNTVHSIDIANAPIEERLIHPLPKR